MKQNNYPTVPLPPKVAEETICQETPRICNNKLVLDRRGKMLPADNAMVAEDYENRQIGLDRINSVSPIVVCVFGS